MSITEGIYIVPSRIWGQSIKRVLGELAEYYSSNNPYIILNFTYNMEELEGQVILNKKIRHMIDKIEMNRLFDKFKIRHPKTYYSFDEIPFDLYDECVVKKQFSERGNGIAFTTFDNIHHIIFSQGYYVQYYIPFEREYRIGIDFKRILGVREKIIIPPHDPRIKNSKSCEYITIKDNHKLEKFALKIFKKFEVDFAGIDIGECNGQYYAIEINSAPTVGEVWARRLSDDLKELYHKRR